MNEARKQLWLDYLQSLMIAFGFSTIFTVVTVAASRSSNKPFPVPWWLLLTFPGFLFGTGFFLMGAVRSRIRLKTFLLNVIAQTGLIAVTLAVCMVLFLWFSASILSGETLFSKQILTFVARVTLVDMPVWFLLGIVLAFMVNSFFQISRKLGPGVLWNWVTGKYYTPREEELVFMFLDLKDSTTLAEQLGNLKFSALVRDFFRDLTLPVLECKAAVSHYIGDEAVIYWKPGAGLEKARCIDLFYKFRAALDERGAYYLKEYGTVPRFKAGLHLGHVVATEVGEVKSEIVFHGDVLNTTARIQGLCNESGENLLLSKELLDRLTLPAGLQATSIGLQHLKGKEHPVEVFAVRQSESSGQR